MRGNDDYSLRDIGEANKTTTEQFVKSEGGFNTPPIMT